MHMRASNDPELVWCHGHSLPVEVTHGGPSTGASRDKQLVELHDGSVEAANEGVGVGSVLTASLPLAVHEQTPASDTASDPASDTAVAANQVAEQPQCILVVDDNVDLAESMSMLLRFRGHEVFVAHNGVTALQLAGQVSPAVVLLDIGLPDMDGYEVCRRLRRSGLEKARIIAMTGYGSERDSQRAEAAGFDEHCVKPVAYADLVKLLSA